MDENDLKILEILDKDSRIPYDEIGNYVDLTGNAVRSRVMSMIEDGVIEEFVFKIKPDVFNIHTCYVTFTCPYKFQDVGERIDKTLGDDPHYVEIITTIDGVIIIQINALDEEDLENAIKNLKSKLKNIEFQAIMKTYKPEFEEIKINNPMYKILDCLITDVRMSIAELARTCNMTSKSVKYYLDQINQNNIGKFSLNYQPNKISQRIFVYLFICKPDTDYVHFISIFNKLKKKLKPLIFKEHVILEPPGILCAITTESLSEIDDIEQEIIENLKEGLVFRKMFPSNIIYRDSIANKIIRDKIKEFENMTI